MSDIDISKLHVLVVDDDVFMRDLLIRSLKEIGTRMISSAENGYGALTELQAALPKVDVILLDLEMPRMDGFEFLENYIREVDEKERIPILVYSGKDLTEVQENLLKGNVAGMVRKDEVSMEELSVIVKNIYSDSQTP